MTTVIGVRFKDGGKVYYFDPKQLSPKSGSYVIVETARGVECGIVAMEKSEVEDSAVVLPLKQIVREANDKDIAQMEKNRAKEKEAFDICLEKIEEHKLEMKLVDVEVTFDNSKMLFYFTADGRIDFRELVKDLASVFRTRIELRQIGVRDESKMLGGLGVCGRPFCCSSFLGEFQPVSIKMAKDQGLSLNLAKISGTCGRLMCCLKYEQSVYDELLKITPRQGSYVSTNDGNGTVTEVSLLKGTLKVKLDGHEEDNTAPVLVSRDEVKLIRPPKPKKEDKKDNEEEIPNVE
ncbi:MAG: stage 0 sporulation family protein [Oscillospiraceae bacterium]|nr:stage 0 sporulation family protein [Oscillospiraceae bacterium]